MRQFNSMHEWQAAVDSGELKNGEVAYVTGFDPAKEYNRFFSQKNPFKKNVLERANDIVKERGKSYGHPYAHFSRVAKLWSVLTGAEITPDQVVKCMIALKLDRLTETPNHQDSIDDLAGYVWCLDEVVKVMNGVDVTV